MTIPRPAAAEQAIARLQCEALDVLVLGGGIVGAGVARDAALRGLRVGLIDRHDFAFGTSSRSSRLLHGGIRYLAQGRIGLVRQASVEKMVLHRIAPHLTEPTEFLFPAYRNSGWPLWQLRIGVKFYDWLCRGGNFGKSAAMDAPALLERAPGLQPDGLAGGVRYFDAFTNDARLVLDTLRSAERAGACLANYVCFESAEKKGDGFRCHVTDVLAQRSFAIETRCVVNATGPWAQGLGLSREQLRLTKGIHLVFDRARLPVRNAVVITDGPRVLFVIPWAERVIVGTTDTDYEGPIDDVRSEPADVAYLLSTVARYFPGARLNVEDVVSSWAGLRPLQADRKGRPSDISRSHRIDESSPGWWDVAGGKLTTYRLMAEHTVDSILRRLNRSARCMTADEPLLAPEEVRGVSQVVPPAPSREVVAHACSREWAVHLDDVLVRRTGWHAYYRDDGALAKQAAEWMAQLHGWDAKRAEFEWRRHRAQSDWPVANRDLFAERVRALRF